MLNSSSYLPHMSGHPHSHKEAPHWECPELEMLLLPHFSAPNYHKEEFQVFLLCEGSMYSIWLETQNMTEKRKWNEKKLERKFEIPCKNQRQESWPTGRQPRQNRYGACWWEPPSYVHMQLAWWVYLKNSWPTPKTWLCHLGAMILPYWDSFLHAFHHLHLQTLDLSKRKRAPPLILKRILRFRMPPVNITNPSTIMKG